MRTSTHGLFVALLALTVGCFSNPGATRDGRVEGVVRDEYTGAPLADAVVRVVASGASAHTDADGRFALTTAPGVHTLAVEGDGHFALERRDVAVAPGESVREDVELPPTAPSEELVERRLAALEAGRVHRDSPDDPGLRPEVAAWLRGERAELPMRAPDTVGTSGESREGVAQVAQALVGMCGASLPTPPTTIRIWRRGIDRSTSSCRGRVDRIPFEDYVKGVLPHEWIPSWHRESLRAGALAIRTYSWRWVLAGGKYDCADLDDTTASQVYRGDRMAVTDAAVDATRGQGIVRSGRLVTGEYSAENSDPTADGVREPLCRGRARFGHGRGMCQWGSSRWASSGRDHVWIAQHYWPGSSIGCGGDTDRDGVADTRDNCPRNANATQADADRDGRGDACDNCPRESNPAQADRDDDDRGDACDNCPAARNADQRDTDRDGDGDACDNCDAAANADQRDTDRDARGDVCDTDDDNDTIADATDNCALVANRDQADRDRDGRGDACDDGDGDGVLDATDRCPTVADRDQEDLDGDGTGDACDADDDADGVADMADNCPREENADQADADGDTQGDACDDDRDGDGVINGADNCPGVANPDQANADGDMQGDACDPTPTAPQVEDAGFVREPEDASVTLDGALSEAPLDGGCSCDVPGASRTSGSLASLVLVGLAVVVGRAGRRR